MLRAVCRLLPPILILAGCGPSQPHVQVRRLPSGEPVNVLGVAKVNFAASGPALMLRYQTDLNMDDVDAVHAEAQRNGAGDWRELRQE